MSVLRIEELELNNLVLVANLLPVGQALSSVQKSFLHVQHPTNIFLPNLVLSP